MKGIRALQKQIPLWAALAIAVLAVSITLAAVVAQVPAVTETVKALRGKTVTVQVADVTFTSVTLVDTDGDERANKVTVVFSLDAVPDAGIKITVTLKNNAGSTLDSGSATFASTDLTTGSNTKDVSLNNAAVMNNVKSIVIEFTTP